MIQMHDRLDEYIEAAETEPGVALSRLVALARATGRREEDCVDVADEDLVQSFGEWGTPIARAIVTGHSEDLDPVKRAEVEIIFRLAGF